MMANSTANPVANPNTGSSSQPQLMKMFTMASEILLSVNPSESLSIHPVLPGFFMLFTGPIAFKYVLITLIEH
jgi:hypothetical protein